MGDQRGVQQVGNLTEVVLGKRPSWPDGIEAAALLRRGGGINVWQSKVATAVERSVPVGARRDASFSNFIGWRPQRDKGLRDCTCMAESGFP